MDIFLDVIFTNFLFFYNFVDLILCFSIFMNIIVCIIHCCWYCLFIYVLFLFMYEHTYLFEYSCIVKRTFWIAYLCSYLLVYVWPYHICLHIHVLYNVHIVYIFMYLLFVYVRPYLFVYLWMCMVYQLMHMCVLNDSQGCAQTNK